MSLLGAAVVAVDEWRGETATLVTAVEGFESGPGEILVRERAAGSGPEDGPLSSGSLSSTGSGDVCLGLPGRGPLGVVRGLVCATSVPKGETGAAFAARFLTWIDPGLTSKDRVFRSTGSEATGIGLAAMGGTASRLLDVVSLGM